MFFFDSPRHCILRRYRKRFKIYFCVVLNYNTSNLRRNYKGHFELLWISLFATYQTKRLHVKSNKENVQKYVFECFWHSNKCRFPHIYNNYQFDSVLPTIPPPSDRNTSNLLRKNYEMSLCPYVVKKSHLSDFAFSKMPPLAKIRGTFLWKTTAMALRAYLK